MAELPTYEQIGKRVLESIEVAVNNKTGLTVEECVVKQIPKRPDLEADGYADGQLVYDTWICPRCNARYNVDCDDYKYCPNCGQRLDWSEESEKES